ncbi:CLUMA_CG002066, isoform A [Clunio marinus]|uniref:CLUMA_CG002066, isoform A n=1 Tax=Clunio marinus TaxID=568069 RepID=A0A1J1HJR7_9DIPT|nr:CLUMA_CG002066, isoform A [Clunio marinus]
MFPLAALLTGALMTIGVAVLLIVILAIKKNREQPQPHENGIKEKHIGMDITVTTPLEMNVGQQKYVVAYTLKGSEKQPDILNAQKSTDAIDSVQKMGSPAAIRPDALFSTSSSSSSKHTKSNEQQQHQQHSTPPSHQSTLKYNDNGTKSYMTLNHNHSMTGNYNVQPPPYTHSPAMMNDYEAPLNYTVNYNPASGASNAVSTYRKISPEYNNLNNLFNSTNTTTSATVNSHLKNELLESSDNFLEFERAVLDNRLSSGVNNSNEEYEFTNNANGPNVNNERFQSTNEFVNETMDYKNLANQIANTISNINSTLNRSRNRNHILTENLPGPESCV